MEKYLTEIHQSLQALIGLHRQLLETVRREREALTQADLSGIQEATFAKEALIEQIRNVDAARTRSLAELALSLKRPMRELTLTNIVISVQTMFPKHADQLRSSYNALQVLTDRISEQNGYNRELIERSLEHVHNMKQNVLGESVPASSTYSAQGQKVNRGASGARLISQEA